MGGQPKKQSCHHEDGIGGSEFGDGGEVLLDDATVEVEDREVEREGGVLHHLALGLGGGLGGGGEGVSDAEEEHCKEGLVDALVVVLVTRGRVAGPDQQVVHGVGAGEAKVELHGQEQGVKDQVVQPAQVLRSDHGGRGWSGGENGGEKRREGGQTKERRTVGEEWSVGPASERAPSRAEEAGRQAGRQAGRAEQSRGGRQAGRQAGRQERRRAKRRTEKKRNQSFCRGQCLLMMAARWFASFVCFLCASCSLCTGVLCACFA